MKLRPGIALKISLAACIALLPALPAAAAEKPAPQHLTGAAAALDGGSLIWRQDGRIIRLYGLAAPPLWLNGSLTPAGQAARQHLQSLVEGKMVTCRLLPDDGRQPRGQCQVESEVGGGLMIDLVIDLVSAGHGLVDRLQTQQQDFGAELGRAYDAAEARAAESWWPKLKFWEAMVGNILGALLAGAAAGFAAWLTIRATREAAQIQILAERYNYRHKEIDGAIKALKVHFIATRRRIEQIKEYADQIEPMLKVAFQDMKDQTKIGFGYFDDAMSHYYNSNFDYTNPNLKSSDVYIIKEICTKRLDTIRVSIESIPEEISLEKFNEEKYSVLFSVEFKKRLRTFLETRNADDCNKETYKNVCNYYFLKIRLDNLLEKAQSYLEQLEIEGALLNNKAAKLEQWFKDHGELIS